MVDMVHLGITKSARDDGIRKEECGEEGEEEDERLFVITSAGDSKRIYFPSALSMQVDRRIVFV